MNQTIAQTQATDDDARKAIKKLVKKVFTTPGARILVVAMTPDEEENCVATRIVSSHNPAETFFLAKGALAKATVAWLDAHGVDPDDIELDDLLPDGRRTQVSDPDPTEAEAHG